MSAAVHRIDRLVFDFAVDGEARARPLQERFSIFCRDRLPHLLDEGFGGVGEAHLVLERMELDLGTIPARIGDEELERLLARALAAGLRRLRIGEPGPDGRPSEGTGQALRRAGARFADGAPAARSQGAAPEADTDAILLAALREGPAALAAAVRGWGVRQRSRARLARTLSAPVRGQLLRLLAPAQADAIDDYLDELAQRHRRRALVPESAADFAAVAWELALAYLLAERGSQFNRRSFIGGHLRRLAARYRMAYADLLARLHEPLTGQAPALDDGLRAMLADLAREAQRERGAEAAESAPGVRAGAGDAVLLDGLAAFLDAGAWPLTMPRAATVAGVLALLRQNDPDALRLALRRHGTDARALRRLQEGLSRRQTGQLICLIEPAEGERIVRLVDAVVRVQGRERVAPVAPAPFAALAWQLALRYLLDDRGSVFNTRSFVGDLLRRLALSCGQSYRSLLLRMLAVAPAPGRKGGAGLADILLALADEALLGQAPAAGAGAPDAFPVPAGEAERIAAFMRVATSVNARLGLAGADAFGRRLDDCVRAWLAASRHGADGVPAPRLAGMTGAVLRALAARYRRLPLLLLREALAAGAAGHALRGELLALYRHDARQAARMPRPPPLAPAQALETTTELALFYLARGVLPAAAPPGSESAVLRLLNGAGAAVGEALAPRLSGVGDREGLARRLLRHLPPSALRALLRRLAPGLSGLIESLLLAAAGARTMATMRAPGPETLLDCHWQQVLAVLLEPGSAAWPAQRLLGAIGARVADRLALPRAAYFAAIADAAAARARVRQRFEPLLDVLAQLRTAPAAVPAAPRAVARAVAKAVAPPGGASPACRALELALRYGAVSAASSPPAAAHLVEAALAEDPVALRRLVLAAAVNELERHRLATMLTVAQLERIWPVPSAAADAGLPSPAFSAGAAALRRARAGQHVDGDMLLARAVAVARRDGGADAAMKAALAQRRRRGLARELETTLADAEENAAVNAPTAVLPAWSQTLPSGTAFHVPNAGLVLLWQFIAPYFAALGLLSGGDFAGPAQRGRAVHLLQLLASGETAAAEHALLLNKFLCGWELAAPLDAASCAPAGERERALAGQLLHSVTQHWPPLKNTSIEVLRATFLMRAGSLRRDDGRWILGVEPGPFDMLLRVLPWTRSTVRLSWMDDILWVEWP